MAEARPGFCTWQCTRKSPGRAPAAATGGFPMPREPDTPSQDSPEPLDQLRHDLTSPLTTILGRTQLLARAIHRSLSLEEPERTAMPRSILAVELAVHEMVQAIDGIGREGEGDAPG